MKLVDGIWLTDEEKHFPEWWNNPKNKEFIDGKATYQIRKYREAMRYVGQRRNAIDVGGHVGLWSMQMAKDFAHVHAFEPVVEFRNCYQRNLLDRLNITLYACALGAALGNVDMVIDPADTGGTHVAPDGHEGRAEGDVVLMTLDHYKFEDVDFMKIDCEGYEHHVIAGARETLLRCKPVVIVEQKPHKLGPNFGIQGRPAVDAIVALGAKLRGELSGDFILSWDA